MRITNLNLVNFRNHESVSFKFNPGINVISGKNGKGKTNILEAIYYSSFGKSFKTNSDAELSFNKGDGNFYIHLEIENSGINKVDISLVNNKKIFKLNNKPLKKVSDLNKYLNVLLFEPSMSLMFKDVPSTRRIYLDLMISKLSSKYLQYLKRYKNLLKERNLALKQDRVDKIYIFTLTNEMVALSEEITSIRLKIVEMINQELNTISKEISNNSKKLKLVYFPLVNLDEHYSENLLRLYQQTYQNDLDARVTTIGIHKEDYSMLIDGKNIATNGSQGENRLAVISFILSPYFIAKDGNKPIVILDDVLSELDINNQRRLLEFVKKLEQTFITSTSLIGEGNEIEL